MEHVKPAKEQCCGCGACKNSCPHNAISMVADHEGFIYPSINEEKCTHCDICRDVCSFAPANTSEPLSVYAYKLGSKAKRRESQSGGAFYALADKVLNEGGIVYGAALCDDFVVRHIRVDRHENLPQLHGSKYVQSDISDVYPSLQKDLEKFRVLFTGTPCQIDAVNAYVQTHRLNATNLTTCDLICHGTPSPKIFSDYLEQLKKDYRGDIEQFVFRYKAAGWHSHFEKSVVRGKPKYSNAYTTIFYSHLSLRECCFCCPYAKIGRVADITIGDFWGIEKTMPQIDDNTGVSLILCNTEKALSFVNHLKKLGTLYESDIVSCLQPQLKGPAVRPEGREAFWHDYQTLDKDVFFQKYGGKLSLKYRLLLATNTLASMRRIKRKIKTTIKR